MKSRKKKQNWMLQIVQLKLKLKYDEIEEEETKLDGANGSRGHLAFTLTLIAFVPLQLEDLGCF